MSISKDDVLHVAKLAHLELDAEQAEQMLKDMNRILEYAGRLDTVKLGGKTSSVTPADRIPLRDDVVEPWLDPGEATSGAPGAENDLFKVPPALSGEAE